MAANREHRSKRRKDATQSEESRQDAPTNVQGTVYSETSIFIVVIVKSTVCEWPKFMIID